MKPSLSVFPAFFLFIGIQLSLGCSSVSAQSSASQVTGYEFGSLEPEGFSDSQFNLLWNAYSTKSDSLLGKFFNNWRLETQIVEEPLLDSPISNATASLYFFLLNSDFQNSNYPYEYAVIQNQIEATLPSTLWSTQDDYILRNFHPQSNDPYHPTLVMLDSKHNGILGDFLGDWSEGKAEAAQQFFGLYVPFGVDVDNSENQSDWALARHWYSFAFTSDLQEAYVTDQTPSGPVRYTCVVGPEGNWERVSDGVIIIDPPQPPEPLPVPPEPPPGPPPYPPHPPHPPHPAPSTPYIPVPTPPSPEPPSKPPGRPRPIGTTRPTSPQNPIHVERPRPIAPQPNNPSSPQTPALPGPNPPTTHQPTSPPTARPRQNQPSNIPAPPQKQTPEKPRTNPPPQNNPPPDKKTRDSNRDR